MTVTLLTSQSAPTTTDADALVTGVFQGQDGPVLTLSTDEIDLMAALTALGATGKAEELTKIPTGGQLTAPVIVAVGLGPEPGGRGGAEPPIARPTWSGCAAPPGPPPVTWLLPRRHPRDPGQVKRVVVALPAGEPDEAEAVALGSLLGGYAFRKYRTTRRAR